MKNEEQKKNVGKSNVMLSKFDLKIKHVCAYPRNVFEIELGTLKGRRTLAHTHTVSFNSN